MANLNGIAGDIVGQSVTNLLNRFSPFIDQLDQCRQVLRALKQGEITLDQVQITENGDVRVLPKPPVDVPSVNGTKDVKDLVGVTDDVN